MSIRNARVRDFQSVADATVTFGDFTVLVGPSNSGKSAFLRALRACLRNTAVPANVRQGTTKALITVELNDGTVEIERGKSLSTYRLTRPGQETETFAKSGRQVPDEIARLIRLPLVEDLDATFSFQFDRPFLLAEPGSTAAQVLGSLTNVSTLHSAVREANRRRQEAAGVLKVRRGDVVRYRERIEDYRTLPERRAALEQAAEWLQQAQIAADRILLISRQVARARAAEQALESLTATEPVDVSDRLAEVEVLLRRRTELCSTVAVVSGLVSDLRRAATEAKRQRAEADRLQVEHATLLKDLGVCPTCGADTSSI